MSKILVVAEVKGGDVRKPTLELLTKIRQEGWTGEAVLLGSGIRDKAALLGEYGAQKVYVADDAGLQHFALDRFMEGVRQAIEQAQPDQVWLSTSEMGKALGPALAATLGAPFAADAMGLELSDGSLTISRPAMATKVVQKLRFKTDGLKVLTIRSGAFDAESGGGGSPEVVELGAPAGDGRMTVKEVKTADTGQIDLGEASTIVSVGRGVKGPEGVEFVKPLVDTMGAAMGASRAVVDSGWLPYEYQVGQTGRVVTPDVYFAIGISGAIQHLAGMSGSKLIVAVNKDPDAPIFSVADYGIVGDLFKVVPVLVEEIKKHKS